MAQCFDGAAVMSSGLNGVQAKVKKRAPLASFIHCYAHWLKLVLTQGASKLKEYKIFFAHLNGLAVLFLDHLSACSYWTKSASGVSLMWHQHGGSMHPEWSVQYLRREML